MRHVVALALVAASFGVHARVASAAPTSKLVYSRSVDASSCPDEQVLRRAVAARIGYDPFFAYAPKTIVAGMSRRNQTFVATVELIDESGVSHGARELHAGGECGELLDTVALAIAIAIDPQRLTRPAPPSPAVATTPPAPPEPPPIPPTADEPAPQPAPAPSPVAVAVLPEGLALEASAGVVGSAGVAPSPSIGASLGAGGRLHRGHKETLRRRGLGGLDAYSFGHGVDSRGRRGGGLLGAVGGPGWQRRRRSHGCPWWG